MNNYIEVAKGKIKVKKTYKKTKIESNTLMN